ncbi:hypothetical protein B0H13DRAFT_1994305 [Mycena leptocephala]|nr:hypothetical protein B0H13DRAFT_1994305 [Mycena leptocephala]
MEEEPFLPVELEREIFETTTLMHLSAIPALLRVARRVLVWIEPLLYRVVRMRHHDTEMVRALFRAMKSKPPEFFHNAVHHLIITANVPWPGEHGSLLELCTGVISLACSSSFPDPNLLSVVAQMRIRRLSVALTRLFGGSICAQISILPSLTHLSLDFHVPTDILMTVLVNCPRLKLLLVLWPSWDQESYELACIPRVCDVRFVMASFDDYWAEWEAGAMGLPNFWSRGDDFVARKRRGEIEVTCYWLN